MTNQPAIMRGLEQVVITTTALSSIDGTNGRLSYAGYGIHDLAEHATFEEVVYLLWHGSLPNSIELESFKRDLVRERTLQSDELDLARRVPLTGHGMDSLRSLVSMVAQLDKRSEELGMDAALRVGTRVLAKAPVLIAAWNRLRNGLQPVESDPTLGHAANFLYMLHGDRPSPEAVRAFDTYLVLLAEHGLNASTFAARVAISAQSDTYSALVAAISTLKGLLHGGANQKAMETFIEIGTPDQAPAYVENVVAHRGRLMGVGHRIYKVEDPRMRPLRDRAAALAAVGDDRWVAVADAVGKVVAEKPFFTERRLAPNVEFYSAPLLYTLGLPLDLFTAAFALSRTAGWIGHIREQIADNRLIRPQADYTGPENRVYVPLAERP